MEFYVIQVSGELPEVAFTKSNVFDAIKDCQHIVNIWSLNTDEEILRDVTEDTAREFLKKFGDNYDAKKYVPEFIIKMIEDEVDEVFSNEFSINSDYAHDSSVGV